MSRNPTLRGVVKIPIFVPIDYTLLTTCVVLLDNHWFLVDRQGAVQGGLESILICKRLAEKGVSLWRESEALLLSLDSQHLLVLGRGHRGDHLPLEAVLESAVQLVVRAECDQGVDAAVDGRLGVEQVPGQQGGQEEGQHWAYRDLST
jgi:hypothetical protein